MTSLILGSGSPRRKRLLALGGFPVANVVRPDVAEDQLPGEAPIPFARRISLEKAQAVPGVDAWVLAADTIVHLDAAILGKPTDLPHAARMLRQLSGVWHKVTTSWCLRWTGPSASLTGQRLLRGHKTSRVRFRSLTEVEIHRYIATGEGVDKAGGYAVQGDGASLIERVVGSTTNVIGLPMDVLGPVLESLGIAREPA